MMPFKLTHIQYFNYFRMVYLRYCQRLVAESYYVFLTGGASAWLDEFDCNPFIVLQPAECGICIRKAAFADFLIYFIFIIYYFSVEIHWGTVSIVSNTTIRYNT